MYLFWSVICKINENFYDILNKSQSFIQVQTASHCVLYDIGIPAYLSLKCLMQIMLRKGELINR